MVIIEGVDGSGKTTLLRQLHVDGVVKKTLSSPYRKESPETFYNNCCEMIREYGHRSDVAVDRFLFSELVYGPVLRSKLHLTWEQSRSIMNLLRRSRSIVVWCCPPLEIVCRDIHREPQMAGVVHHLETIYWAYAGLFSVYNSRPVLRYDWTVAESYHALKVKIKELM